MQCGEKVANPPAGPTGVRAYATCGNAGRAALGCRTCW